MRKFTVGCQFEFDINNTLTLQPHSATMSVKNSDEMVLSRPSTKVSNPPGGKSSISFGWSNDEVSFTFCVFFIDTL